MKAAHYTFNALSIVAAGATIGLMIMNPLVGAFAAATTVACIACSIVTKDY